MRAIVLMFDSLNRHMLPPYAQDTFVEAPNFQRLASKSVTFDNFYAGSMPCMPARREIHTGRYNFLHRSWGPLEPFDDSMPEILSQAGVHTHLISDHQHYWEDGGATYHTRYSTWEFMRGQEGDPWKGVAGSRPAFIGADMGATMKGQDRVNRRYMPTEAEHNQTRAVDAGVHFLEANAQSDKWMLQLELFDPHEPFFSHQPFREKYDLPPEDHPSDWPAYRKVTEDSEGVEEVRREYAALVSMCDKSLGRVLDVMDEHQMWDDTMLIVNTDHGFLLGERGWWGKSVMPWFNELANLPFFLWDPRHGAEGQRCQALAQTIDLAPTVLSAFDLEATEDMQGQDLGKSLAEELPGRPAALWGVHGAHVNITDGRYVYMRSCATPENEPLEEFTLMPTHMRSRFRPDELREWQPAEAFNFTKGLRTIRVKTSSLFANPWAHGTQLYDLDSDPGQVTPLVDDVIELEMAELLTESLRAAEAPASQFQRLGLPAKGPVTVDHVLAGEHRERVLATAEPLPSTSELPCVLRTPVRELLATPAHQSVLQEYLPDLVKTEQITLPPGMTLVDLASRAQIPARTLVDIGRALDASRQ